MDKLTIKSKEEVEIMKEAGKKLSRVKSALKKAVKVGASAMEIEELACKLIKEEGAVESFKKVPGYSWATCISVNSGLVHGIPKREMVFKSGDVVSVDVGLYFKGFHSDTSFTVGLDVNTETAHFLEVGKKALNKAIKEARVGKHIYDISKAIEVTLTKDGYSPVRALVGHGIGRQLHEDPQIPCFVPEGASKGLKIVEGMVLAIEVMYAMGSHEVALESDGWTIAMRDGKISALFEETVAITSHGPLVLTEG